MPFPVSYWYGPPREEMTPQRYREIAACGFTIAAPPQGSSSSVELNLQHLDLCRETGLLGLVGDRRLLRERDALPLDRQPGWEQEVADAVEDYRGHPALYGYYVGDEPHRRDFDDQARVCRLLRDRDPQHIAYINLYPNYAAPHLPGSALDQLGTPSYEEHVAAFLQVVRPQVLSYDHYALFDDGGVRPDYFANLEIIRRHSLSAQVPFWQIVLLTPHFRYRDPDEADLRWQVYTTLAYGGRGLAYFTYWTPDHANFRDAIIDPFGDRTPHYAVVRRINRELHALAPTILALTSRRVLPLSGAINQPGGVVRGVEGGSFVIGEFDGPDGAAFLLLVNNDRGRSARARVELARPAAVQEVNRVTGALSPLQEEGEPDEHPFWAWLAPGDGRLFRLVA